MKKFLIPLIAGSFLLLATPSYALFGGGGGCGSACQWARKMTSVTNWVNGSISSLQSQLQVPGGLNAMYALVGRQNDIFTFCREGIPTDGWVGVNPQTGQFQIINPYGNPQWIPYYAVICPYGVNPAMNPLGGVWMGPGTGGMWQAGPNVAVPLITNPH